MIPNVDLRICFKWVGEPTTNQLCSLGLLGALRGSFPPTPGLEDVESSTHQGPEILPNLTTLVASDIQRSKKHKCPKVAWLVTPPKFNMEPENDGFQKESAFPGVDFQVPC